MIIKQTLTDQFLTECSSKLQLSNKSTLYHLFKDEHYLTNLRSRKFRTFNNKLLVETGQWTKIPCTEQKCLHCQSQFHYLLECKQVRRYEKTVLLLPKYFYKCPHVLNFKELLNNSDYIVFKTLTYSSSYIMKLIF